MKRHILFTAILVLALQASAQTKGPGTWGIYWPNTPDTICCSDTSGGLRYNVYDPIDELWGETRGGGWNRHLARYIIDEPTWLIGLAGTVETDTMVRMRAHWIDSVNNYRYSDDWKFDNARTCYLFLYHEKNGVFRVVDSILADTLPYPTRSYEYDCYWNGDKYIIPLTETLFRDTSYLFGVVNEETPDGRDTIYVGWGLGGLFDSTIFRYVQVEIYAARALYETPQVWYLHTFTRRFEQQLGPGLHYNESIWGGLFPKVRPYYSGNGRDCAPPMRVRLVSFTGDECAVISWNSTQYCSEWEVALRTDGQSMEQATLFSVQAPTATLCDLLENTDYYVCVRTVCRFDDTVKYSNWSSELHLRIGNNAIGEEPEGGMVWLGPNPATTAVRVVSNHGLRGVELYDLRGHKVMEKWLNHVPQDNLDGITATLDVSTLPKGVYVASIHTIGGIVTRKLLVE